MEADRFENLLRAVATQTSRRGLAGILGGLALGGVLALDTGDEAEAAPRRRRRARRRKRASDPFTPSPILPPPPYRIVPLNGACTTPSACIDWFVPGQDGLECPVVVDSDSVPCPWVTCAPVVDQKGGKQCAQGTQCCRREEAPCSESCQCCGSLVCESGFCASCLTFGGTCSNDSECCGEDFCGGDGTCTNG